MWFARHETFVPLLAVATAISCSIITLPLPVAAFVRTVLLPQQHRFFFPSNVFALTGLQEDESVSSSSIPNYLRIVTEDAVNGQRQTKIELQTCITTFEDSKRNIKIDLHAQVHFADELYYRYYNNETEFTSLYDRIHYELIASEKLLALDGNWRKRIVDRDSLMPPLADQQTALRYNLTCQLDAVNYAQPKWYCSDYTREEFLRLQQHDQRNAIPITNLGGEILTALVRPSTPAQDGLKTRLFSNLFLSGEGLTLFIRSLLWITVPVPELSILLLDWSSLSPRPGGISPLAEKVLESLLMGDLSMAQKLIFTQMLVSGQANLGSTSLIIGRRNEHAMQVLKKSIDVDGCSRNALIYGALHCKDLQKRLMENGFRSKGTKWRTAWTITTSSSKLRASSNYFGLFAVPFLLLVGGLDWLSTWQEIGHAYEIKDFSGAAFSALLYLARHAAIYMSLAKFVIEWDTGLFEADGR